MEKNKNDILGGSMSSVKNANNGTDKGQATRGYKPEPSERTFEGFVKIMFL